MKRFFGLSSRRALAPVLLSFGLGCGASAGGGKSGGGTAVPEGDDDIAPMSELVGVEGTLFNGITADADHVYACTGQHGLRVASVDGSALKVVTDGAKFPEGDGCFEVTVGPDGKIWAIGPRRGEPGGWIAAFAPGASGATISPLVTGGTDVLADSLLVTDTHAFVALGPEGLAVFQIDGETLKPVATLGGFEQALGLAISGDRLFVANGRSGVAEVDVSDPTKPAIVNETKVPGATVRRLAVDGDRLYAAGLAIAAGLDISGDTPALLTPTWESHASATDVAVSGGGLVFLANTEDLVVLDGSGGAPTLVGSELLPSQTKARARVISVAAIGSLAIAAEWSALWSLASAIDRPVPDMRLDRLSIDFGVANLKKGKGIVVQNLGDEPLDIAELSIDNPLFEVNLAIPGLSDATSGTIEPGGKELIQVSFEPADDQPATALLTVKSNDPDEGTVTIKITANAGSGAQVGRPVDPNSEMVFVDSLTGNDVTLTERFNGKAVLMVYFATWCGACAQELPELQRQLNELGNPNAAVLGIAMEGDTAEQIAVFRENHGIEFDIWIDNAGNDRKLIDSGVEAFPTEFVIDREHIVVFNDPNAYAGEAFNALTKAAAKQ